MRAGKHGGRPLAAALALLFGVLLPLTIAAPVAAASTTATTTGSTGAAPSTRPPEAGAAGDLAGAARAAAKVAPDAKAAPTTAGTSAGSAVDPQYPYAKYLMATIDGISPTVVTSATGNLLTVTGVITNATKGPIYDLRYVFQRGDPLSSVKAIKAEIAAPSRPDAVVGQNFKALGATATATAEVDMTAGSSLRFVATVPINSPDGLLIAERGVYPLMIKVSGDIGQNGLTQYERVGEFHLLTTVLSVPAATATVTPGLPSTSGSGSPGTTSGSSTSGQTSTAGPGALSTPSLSTSGLSTPGLSGPGLPPGSAGTTPSTTDIPTAGIPTTGIATTGTPTTGIATPTPTSSPSRTAVAAPAPAAAPDALNLLWPIVDTPHVGVGGIFLDDDLAAEISPGGRLYQILLGLTQVDAGSSATTVVVDPELLAEISRMAGGYRVATQQRPQSALTATTPKPTPTAPTTAAPASAVPASAVPASAVPASSATQSSAAPSAAGPLPAAQSPAAQVPATPTRPAPARSTPSAAVAASTHKTSGSGRPRTAPHPASPKPPATTQRSTPPATTAGVRNNPIPTGTGPGAAIPSTAIPSTAATPGTGTTTTSAATTTSAVTTTSTGRPNLEPPDRTVPGTGQAAATAYLTALRTALAGRQVLVLPYSDPDAVAMVRAGLGKQLASLVSMGRTVAAQVLQLAPVTGPGQPGLITTMSLPPGGVVDDATLALLSANGMSQALLSPKTLQHRGGPAGAVVVDESGNGGKVVDAAVSDADVLSVVETLISKGNSAGLAVRLNTLAAVLVGGNIDGTATALIIAPDNRWTPNLAGLQNLAGLLRILQAGNVLTATPLPSIAATAKTTATVAYPDSARAAELDPGYLAAVSRDSEALTGMMSSLAQTKGDLTLDPSDLFTPLTTAMTVTGSAGLRMDGHVGRSILRTTETTLEPLRSKVTIATGTSYTLAASTSPLLISVRNDLPYVVTVRVVISGTQAVGMTATDPGPLSIPAGQSRQFKIATKVVKAGKFPLQVQLQNVDGSTWSDATPITVRSSAYGALTIVLIIVAGGALFLMVAIRIIQRIRGRYRTEGDDGPPAGGPPRAGPPDGGPADDLPGPRNPPGPDASTDDPVNMPEAVLTSVDADSSRQESER